MGVFATLVTIPCKVWESVKVTHSTKWPWRARCILVNLCIYLWTLHAYTVWNGRLMVVVTKPHSVSRGHSQWNLKSHFLHSLIFLNWPLILVWIFFCIMSVIVIVYCYCDCIMFHETICIPILNFNEMFVFPRIVVFRITFTTFMKNEKWKIHGFTIASFTCLPFPLWSPFCVFEMYIKQQTERRVELWSICFEIILKSEKSESVFYSKCLQHQMTMTETGMI